MRLLTPLAGAAYSQLVARRNGSHSLALEALPQSPTTHPVAAALARMGPRTRQTMLAALRRAAGLLTAGACDPWTLPWADVRYENVVALRQALVDLHLAPASVNHTLACIRAVLTDAWRLGLVPGDVLMRVKDVPPVRTRPLPKGRMLSTVELARLQQSCRRAGILGARDLALVALCYAAGLRRAEVPSLDLKDLRPDGIHVIGKGGLEVIQPLPAAARRLLAPWLRARGGAPGPLLLPVGRFGIIRRRRLFESTVYQALKRRGRAAGIKSFSPHDLRRSFVSHLLDRGVELRVVQKLARHAQVTTTQRYDRRALAQLKTAADRLPL